MIKNRFHVGTSLRVYIKTSLRSSACDFMTISRKAANLAEDLIFGEQIRYCESGIFSCFYCTPVNKKPPVATVLLSIKIPPVNLSIKRQVNRINRRL